VLARDGYHSGADERQNTGLRLSSITHISCDKLFLCNGYIFLRSLKPANFLVSETFWTQIELCYPPNGCTRQGSY